MKLRITLNQEEVRAALIEYVNAVHQVTFQNPALVQVDLYVDGTAAVADKVGVTNDE